MKNYINTIVYKNLIYIKNYKKQKIYFWISIITKLMLSSTELCLNCFIYL